MMKVILLGLTAVCAAVITAALARTETPLSVRHVSAVHLQSQFVINMLAKHEITPDQSLNFIESFVNPYSLIVTDSELNQYATFAANSAVLKWERGFALQLSDETIFLCEKSVFDKGECVKIFAFTKHGLSKSPIS